MSKHPLTTLHPRLLRALGDGIYDRRMLRLVALSDIIKHLESMPDGKTSVAENDADWLAEFASEHSILEETVIGYLKQLADLHIVTRWYKQKNGKMVKAYQLIQFIK